MCVCVCVRVCVCVCVCVSYRWLTQPSGQTTCKHDELNLQQNFDIGRETSGLQEKHTGMSMAETRA